jgi:hypothetical protein
MSRSASNLCLDYAPSLPRPIILSSATNTSKASRHQGKGRKKKTRVWWTISRSIDGCRMECFLTENHATRIHPLTTSPRHAGTCEEGKVGHLRLRPPSQPPDQNVEAGKKRSFSTQTQIVSYARNHVNIRRRRFSSRATAH